MAVLFHGTYGDHFSPLYVFFGVEQASKKFTFAPRVFSSDRCGIRDGIFFSFMFIYM